MSTMTEQKVTKRELILRSIDHWERMSAYSFKELVKRINDPDGDAKRELLGTEQRIERPFADDCPLCHRFNLEYLNRGEGCEGCPVAEKTGQDACMGSPYYTAAERWLYFQESKLNTDFLLWRMAAVAETEFLRSLLYYYPEDDPEGRKVNV